MSRYDGHIGEIQGAILLFIVLSSQLIIQFPEFLIHRGGTSGWQIAMVSTAGGLMLFLPVVSLVGRFPGKGLAEISEEVAGPLLGTLLTLMAVGWLTAEITMTARSFTETFIVAILPKTPPSVLMAGVLACMAYASYRGLEALCRATQILFLVIWVGSILVMIAGLPRINIGFIYPLWGYGLTTTFTQGVLNISMTAEAIILLALGYAFHTAKGIRISGLYAILFAGCITALTLALLVMIFGYPAIAHLTLPLITLARNVYFGRFVQRIEALMVMLWIFSAAVRLSALFHAAVVSLAGALRLPYYRPLIFSMTILLAALSLLPEDFVSAAELERHWIRPSGLIVMLIPSLLLVLAVLRQKGASAHAS